MLRAQDPGIAPLTAPMHPLTNLPNLQFHHTGVCTSDPDKVTAFINAQRTAFKETEHVA